MARKPRGRVLHGIVLLDKPAGVSSNAALQRAKRVFNAQKAGHTGNLDQLATGLLPICFGKATKIASYLLDADKHYEALCHLGQTSNTGDMEGDITEVDPAKAISLSLTDIEQVIPQFMGKQQQIPPMHSAIKHQGKRLYELARKGKEIERQAREIEILALELLEFNSPMLRLRVHCSKGTYIRTLVEDIGNALGCGAMLAHLCRTGVGQYQQMFDFATLEQAAEEGLAQLDAHILSIESALTDYPTQLLSLAEMNKLHFGQKIYSQDFSAGSYVNLSSALTQWCGFAKIDPDLRIRPIVFIEPELETTSLLSQQA